MNFAHSSSFDSKLELVDIVKKNQVLVSIITTAYKGEDFKNFPRLLKSLKKFNVRKFELVVLIERSRVLWTKLNKFLKSNSFPYKIRLIYSEDRLGLSKARNAGISYSQGEILAFLDHSVIFHSNWLEELLSTYKERKDAIGVGGKSIPIYNKKNYTIPSELNWLLGSHFEGLPKTLSQVPSVIGSNMSFKRESFTSLGGFNPWLGFSNNREGVFKEIMGEETEFCERINHFLNDKKIYYNPDLIVYHKIDSSKLSIFSLIKRGVSLGFSTKIVEFFINKSINKGKKTKKNRRLEIKQRESSYISLMIKKIGEYFTNLSRGQEPIKNLHYLLIDFIISLSTFFGKGLYYPLLFPYRENFKDINSEDIYFDWAFNCSIKEIVEFKDGEKC